MLSNSLYVLPVAVANSPFSFLSSVDASVYPSLAERRFEPSTSSLPLRSSFEPVFSIAFDSDFFSVFSAFFPTVSLPLVVSTASVSFFSTGLFFNFELTVVTSLL